MSRRLITLWIAAAALLQMWLPPWKPFGVSEIPVLSAVLICIALRADFGRVMYAAVLTGLIHDAFCPAGAGFSIPFYVLASAAVHWIRDEIFGDMPFTCMLLGAGFALLETVYYAGCFAAGGQRLTGPGLVFLRLAGGIMAASVTVPLVALLFGRIRRSDGNRRRRFVV